MDEPQKVTSSIELKVGSFVDLEGIESAITNTTFAMKNADQVTRLILQQHLKKLCKLQRTVLSVIGEQDKS